MIYYTKFSEQTVFLDARLNVFCNQIFTFLINKMDEFTVVNNLVLDGKIALLLQDARVDDGVLKIEFSTALKSVFDMLMISVANIDVSECYFEENKIIVINSDVFFEFKLTDYELLTVDYHGIKLHDQNEILKNL